MQTIKHTHTHKCIGNHEQTDFIMPNTIKFLPCTNNHPMDFLNYKPPCYMVDDFATCDSCNSEIDLDDLSETGFYHCGMCEFDLCIECSKPKIQTKIVEVEEKLEVVPESIPIIDFRPRKPAERRAGKQIFCSQKHEMTKYFSKPYDYINRPDRFS